MAGAVSGTKEDDIITQLILAKPDAVGVSKVHKSSRIIINGQRFSRMKNRMSYCVLVKYLCMHEDEKMYMLL